MIDGAKAAAGALAAAAALAACAATGADLSPEETRLREAAYACASGQYDRVFQAAGHDGLYDPDERNEITGLLRDRAVAGQGADADTERRIRNLLGEGYSRLFLDAFAACMADT